MKQEESFGIVPILRDGNETLFLAVRHKAGHWGFPKGHKEAQETGLEAAKRELEEETGIKSYKISDEEKTFSEAYFLARNGEKTRKTVTYWLAEVKYPALKLQENEIADAKWLSLDDALELLTFEESKEILRSIDEFLKKNPHA